MNLLSDMNLRIFHRGFSSSACLSRWKETSKFEGNKVYDSQHTEFDQVKVDFRGLRLFNKRHRLDVKKRLFKKFEHRDPQFADIYEHKYGCRGTGLRHEKSWEHIPEKVPELIVPDLTDCDLKPYVPYSANVPQNVEFTSRHLFDFVYGLKMWDDFEKGKLDASGNALEPTAEEKMTSEEAWIKARQTGSDIFQGGVEPSKEWKVRWERDGRKTNKHYT